jgi:Ca-activated chloride channel family protein
MKAKTIAAFATVLLALAGLSFGQAPAPKAGANMVYIPVAVSGPKNVFVSGLKQENFVLLEDGIQQTVTQFYEENQPIDMSLLLALSGLQRGRSDLNSIKIRESIENFRQQSNSQNKYKVEESSFGANGIFDAIDRHITRLNQESLNPRKILLVVTDGFESSGGEPVRALQEYAKKLDVTIYMVFAPGPPQDGPGRGRPSGLSDDILEVGRGQRIFLSAGAGYEDLTKFTGGRLFQAESDTQLGPFLETLAKELKSQYVLGFKSTNDAKNDKWRKIEVKMKAPQGIGDIKEKDMKPKVRDRYFVAKPK